MWPENKNEICTTFFQKWNSSWQIRCPTGCSIQGEWHRARNVWACVTWAGQGGQGAHMQLGVREGGLEAGLAWEASVLTLPPGRRTPLPRTVLTILTILTIQAGTERTQKPDKWRGSQTDAALGFSSRSHDDEWWQGVSVSHNLLYSEAAQLGTFRAAFYYHISANHGILPRLIWS